MDESVDTVRGCRDPGYEDGTGEEHCALGVGELDSVDAGDPSTE